MASIEDEAMAMFNDADKNSDKSLSHTELKKYMRRERWARTLLTRDDFTWMDFFGEMDTDADGRIQPPEFVEFYKNRLKPLVDEAKAVYDEYMAGVGAEAEAKEDPPVIGFQMNGAGVYQDDRPDPLDSKFEAYYRKMELTRIFEALQRSKTDVVSFADIVVLASTAVSEGQAWTEADTVAMSEAYVQFQMNGSGVYQGVRPAASADASVEAVTANMSSVTVTDCFEERVVTVEWFVEYFIQYWQGGCVKMSREDFDEATNKIFDKVLPGILPHAAARCGRWLMVVQTMNAVNADGKVVGKIQVLSDDTKIQTIGNVKVQINPDGSKIQTHMDTGVRIQTNANGTTIQTNANGNVIQKTPDGVQIDIYPDGRRLQTNADGSQIKTPATGAPVHHAAAGPASPSTVVRMSGVARAVTRRTSVTKVQVTSTTTTTTK